MPFTTPITEQLFLLQHIAQINDLSAWATFAEFTGDNLLGIAEGAAAFAEGAFAPLDRIGDTLGPRWSKGAVIMPPGYKAAYDDLVENGWTAIGGSQDHGGAGLPFSLTTMMLETLSLSNLGFAAIAMLTLGAVEAIEAHGSDRQKSVWLPKLLSGEWSGTMNLTEAQAGSDVGALRSTAEPVGDGLYRIKGQKIFISFGEQDLSTNICHLVLARIAGAPPGTRGVSLFLVPKVRLDEDGRPGVANDVRCVSIEHKLGLHASPTCVMAFGDNDDCIGELIGPENGGMRAMFTMMNNARINVGNQGVQVAERARQLAHGYARDRVQSARADGSYGKAPVAIVGHPDVRRMLLRMNALTQAGRSLLYYSAGLVDQADAGDAAAQTRLDLMTPLVKAYCSDVGCEVASLGIQIHGGMGFIEETGAAQHYRDARILPIYEGTNGIQSIDLVSRKLVGDGGVAFRELMREIRVHAALEPNIVQLAEATETTAEWMLAADLNDRLAGSYSLMSMLSVLSAAWLLLRQAKIAEQGLSDQPGNTEYFRSKIAAMRYYMDCIVPEAVGLGPSARTGAALYYDLSDAELAL